MLPCALRYQQLLASNVLLKVWFSLPQEWIFVSVSVVPLVD
jgi:hypothetical protein